jgi:putative heme transporter
VSETDLTEAALQDADKVPVKPRPKRSRKRQLIGTAIAIAVVVGVFVFLLPKIADYRDVWDVVKTLSWWKILLLVGATALNLATFPPPWMVALPGLRFRQGFVVTQASTASTYVAPGGAAPGMAVSYAMLKAWGFEPQAVALAVAVTGVWNQLAVFGFPIVALGLLTLEGNKNSLLRTVGLIGLIVFVAVVAGFAVGLSSDRMARKIGDLAARIVSRLLRIIRKGPVGWTGEALVRFRHKTIGLLRRRWHVLTVATLAGQLTVFLVLYTSLRVFDVSASEVTGIEAFAAWSLMRLLGSLPLTPGGLGVIELGLTGLLVGFGGNQAEVVAAVLVYRFLTMVPTLVLGLVSAATWKRHQPRPGKTAPAAPGPDRIASPGRRGP